MLKRWRTNSLTRNNMKDLIPWLMIHVSNFEDFIRIIGLKLWRAADLTLSDISLMTGHLVTPIACNSPFSVDIFLSNKLLLREAGAAFSISNLFKLCCFSSSWYRGKTFFTPLFKNFAAAFICSPALLIYICDPALLMRRRIKNKLWSYHVHNPKPKPRD